MARDDIADDIAPQIFDGEVCSGRYLSNIKSLFEKSILRRPFQTSSKDGNGNGNGIIQCNNFPRSIITLTALSNP
ncbi:MAG: hypothetical protein QNJ72_37485, partial [Pleurocapsa sp. MO_226.B13]|nr:hypothetical protein [Pleurocapsa sp. MO_226.B13]